MVRTSRPRSRAQWEELLAKEGLAPLDKDGEMLSGHDAEQKPPLAGLVDAWLKWAQDVFGKYPFEDRKERDIWRLLSRGLSRRQIAKRRTVTVAQIHALVRRVEQWSPIAPPPNPWFRGGSERREEVPYVSDDDELTTVVARDPAAAADMLKQATLYIEDLGGEYMDEFKERIGASDFDTDDYQQYGIASEFDAPDTNVWLPSDGVPMSELSGPVRTLTPEEIAKLDYTPPEKN